MTTLKPSALDPAAVDEKRRSGYPEPFRPRMRERSERKLDDACRLTNFGINPATLGPGGRSALRQCYCATGRPRKWAILGYRAWRNKMRLNTFMRIGIIVVLLSSTPANAMGCSGTACKDVVFSFDNGCYAVTNLGTKRVKVTIDISSFTLERGERHALVGPDNHCVTAFQGIPTANYE